MRKNKSIQKSTAQTPHFTYGFSLSTPLSLRLLLTLQARPSMQCLTSSPLNESSMRKKNNSRNINLSMRSWENSLLP